MATIFTDPPLIGRVNRGDATLAQVMAHGLRQESLRNRRASGWNGDLQAESAFANYLHGALLKAIVLLGHQEGLDRRDQRSFDVALDHAKGLDMGM